MSRPWMPLYVADYLADTAHLRAAQSGAYLHLIMHYWKTGGLPDDDDQLASIARVSGAEWRKFKPTLAAFFHDGWKHKRIDAELAHAAEISSKRKGAAEAKHAKSKANAPANAPANAELKQTQSPSPSPKKDSSEAKASDASASRDIRADLFGRGLQSLARMTGKTPDSCRSLVGRWLKAVDDEAIHVLGAIEDAERNNYADPVGWITKSLQPRTQDGKSQSASVTAERMLAAGGFSFGPRPGAIRAVPSGDNVRLLSAGRSDQPGNVRSGSGGGSG